MKALWTFWLKGGSVVHVTQEFKDPKYSYVDIHNDITKAQKDLDAALSNKDMSGRVSFGNTSLRIEDVSAYSIDTTVL